MGYLKAYERVTEVDCVYAHACVCISITYRASIFKYVAYATPFLPRTVYSEVTTDG